MLTQIRKGVGQVEKKGLSATTRYDETALGQPQLLTIRAAGQTRVKPQAHGRKIISGGALPSSIWFYLTVWSRSQPASH